MGRAAAAPCILLSHLDKVYDVPGAALAIVKRQIGGLYTMAMAKEIYNTEVLTTAAASFVASNGGQCSLYAMMCYFGEYLTKYKQTTALFDISDILRSYKARFAEVWGRLQERAANAGKASVADEETGKAALWRYLRREYVANGRSIRESALYERGFVSETDVAAIERGEEVPI